ncbi:uncharacterized protein LOC129602868 [Paramacrobiotus metropolitanus]|uniref:uncharacterized protein LOC129602868 n=1 Tax=Paramacrobiotus metropolitanus TaxID=2943436 RepID=UPI0024456B04|nr:uncharacterized protein LOC129602868 [Paramacrobiotus metropolitanus]
MERCSNPPSYGSRACRLSIGTINRLSGYKDTAAAAAKGTAIRMPSSRKEDGSRKKMEQEERLYGCRHRERKMDREKKMEQECQQPASDDYANSSPQQLKDCQPPKPTCTLPPQTMQ